MVVVHRLTEVASNPVPQGLIPDGLIGVGGNEDCRDRVPRIDQMPVQLDTSYSGHVNVGDQAGSIRKVR